jgi:hypothetical protein
MTRAKQKEQIRLKKNDLIQKMSAGLGVSLGMKPGAAAELCKECRQHTQKYAQQKTNVFKIECCGSYAQLPTEQTKSCRSLSEI